MEERNITSIIQERDQVDPSPEERAKKVFNRVSDINSYDLLCFSVNFIAVMSTEYPWLHESARSLNRLLYTAHYIDQSQLGSKQGGTIERSDGSNPSSDNSG